MLGKPGPVFRKQGAETEEDCRPTSPRNPLLRASSLPSPSPSSSSSSSASSSSASSFSQRSSTSSDQRRRSKPARERHHHHPKKRMSEPAMLTMGESLAMEADSKEGSVASHASYRRCMTDTDFTNVHDGVPSQAAPDLLQLFNIFQFNTPERPSARMLVNVTLVGNIQPVRLLVAYDASVQDVIKASLKAYSKEGRCQRHCLKFQTYGLHYSPFCLESIDPTEIICDLGTRSFFLFPMANELTQTSKERKPWWNILSLMLT